MTYAPGDHAVFKSNASGGGIVAIDNSGRIQVASFNIQGYYPCILATVSQGTGGIAVVSAGTTPPPVTADILWQNTSSGQASFWEMDGSTLVGGGPVTPNPGPSFRAVGTGDFNDDGKSDILWQNTNTGQASIWEMSGTTITGGGPTPIRGRSFRVIGLT